MNPFTRPVGNVALALILGFLIVVLVNQLTGNPLGVGGSKPSAAPAPITVADLTPVATATSLSGQCKAEQEIYDTYRARNQSDVVYKAAGHDYTAAEVAASTLLAMRDIGCPIPGGR